MRNLPEFIVSYIAIVSIAAVVVPLNGWWTGKVRLHSISYAHARYARMPHSHRFRKCDIHAVASL